MVESSRRVSTREVWGHAVANITPSAMPAVTIVLVAAHGGAFTWLAYALVGLVMWLVAIQLGILARHFPSPGSLFFYLAKALHPVAGLVAGFTMILGYGGALLGAPLLCGLFANTALHTLWPTAPDLLDPLALATLAIAFSLARRGVEISARWGLWVEWFSLACILLIAVLTLAHFGISDPQQWHFSGLHTPSLLSALVLSLLAYGGFETAGNLAAEAEQPRAIPGIMRWAVILVAIFFVFLAYTETLAFHALGQSLGNASTPLNAIAAAMGEPWLGVMVDLAMATAAFSASIATFNSISRILLSMAGHRVLPQALAQRHVRYGTPIRALQVLGALVLASILLFWLTHASVLDLIDIFGTFTALGFVLLYGLSNLAALRYLFRSGVALRWVSLLITLISLPLLGAVFYGTVVPFPGGSIGATVIVFLLMVLATSTWGFYWARFQPARLQAIVSDQL
ncbi:APC family permease [Acidithiobacillus sp. IBUN Pt1247-S3]|uniref:APC family permease n=1 Tax=Acidithiobacillus sp. IBUN Pt1247-S3 TaxID=3166642 RepID=UPI0034E5B797